MGMAWIVSKIIEHLLFSWLKCVTLNEAQGLATDRQTNIPLGLIYVNLFKVFMTLKTKWKMTEWSRPPILQTDYIMRMIKHMHWTEEGQSAALHGRVFYLNNNNNNNNEDLYSALSPATPGAQLTFQNNAIKFHNTQKSPTEIQPRSSRQRGNKSSIVTSNPLKDCIIIQLKPWHVIWIALIIIWSVMSFFTIHHLDTRHPGKFRFCPIKQ